MTDETTEHAQRGLMAADQLQAGRLTLHSSRDGALHTIRLDGELDIASAPDVERELLAVEATDALSIVLDLSTLRFIDSTGVRLLLSAYARSRRDANRLVLLRGPAAVQRVFELTGIAEHLPFAD
jgi:anti-anti-sigma factor